MRWFLVAILCSPAAVASNVGLYPLADAEAAARIHEAMAAAPGVTAFDLIAHSNCAPDEVDCLASAAKRARLDAMVSAAPDEDGFTLRYVSAGGKLLATRRGPVAAAVQDLLAAAHAGTTAAVWVARDARAAPANWDRTATGDAVRGTTVRTATGDAVRAATGRASVPIEAISTTLPTSPRTRAAHVAAIGGFAFLTSALGAELYAHRAGSPAAATGAAALAATGAGALAAAALLTALTQ